jgi:hypothetical protein
MEFVVGLELLRRPTWAARLWGTLLFAAFALTTAWVGWHRITFTCGCLGWLTVQLHSHSLGVACHVGANVAVTLILLTSLALPDKRIETPVTEH